MNHSYAELEKQFGSARNRTSEAVRKEAEALKRLCFAAPNHYGFPVGSVVKANTDHRWLIIGAMPSEGFRQPTRPDAVMIKKDGTNGERKLPYHIRWEDISLIEEA